MIILALLAISIPLISTSNLSMAAKVLALAIVIAVYIVLMALRRPLQTK